MLSTLKRFMLVFGFAAAVLFCAAAAPSVAAAADISVEGEQAAYTNFSGIVNNAAYSGGQLLRLQTSAAAPQGGYIARYEVQAAETGYYRLDTISTPPAISWASPFEVGVNDGPFQPVTDADEFGSVNSTVKKFHLHTVYLQQGTNEIVFRVTERRTSDGLYVLFIDAFMLTKLPFVIESVDSAAPLNVFEAGDNVELNVRYSVPAPADTSLSFEVSDYWDEAVASGSIAVAAEQQQTALELGALQRGHYTVKLQMYGGEGETVTRLGVVVPLAEREPLDDSPFAIDTAASQFVPPALLQPFADAVRLMGVTWIRDRYRWSAINPSSGVYKYDAYDPFIQAFADRGIRVIDVFADAPAWKRGAADKLPLDLQATYEFARDAALHYDGRVDAWEIWNEPNIHYTTGSESADQYAAFLKAFSLGIADGAAGAKAALGGLAGVNSSYMELLMKNDVLSYLDIYNFHAYPKPYDETKPLVPFPGNAAIHRDFLLSQEEWDKRLWLTESGLPIPSALGAGLSRSDQMRQARYLITSTVQALAEGVDKHFWFIMSSFHLNNRQYGLLHDDYTPYPAFVAEAVLTDALGHGVYAGRIPDVPAAIQAHLFRDGDASVAVFWSEQPQTIEAKLFAKTVERIDLMGGKETLTAMNGKYTLQIGPDPIFVRVDKRIYPQLGGDCPEGSGSEGAPESNRASALDQAQRVVLAQRYSENARVDSKALGAYSLERSGVNTVTVDVYNFNDTTVSGIVYGTVHGSVYDTVYGDWRLNVASQSVVLAPGEHQRLIFELTAAPGLPLGTKADVVFRGLFDGLTTTASTATVTARLEQIAPDALVPGADDPERWLLAGGGSLSSTGSGVFTEGSEPGAVRFKYAFGEGSRWAFPYLHLPIGTDYSDKDGFVFWLYADQEIPHTDLKVMANIRGGGGRYLTQSGFVIRAGWNPIVVPFELFHPQQDPDNTDPLDTSNIASLQLGINTTLADVPAFEIRELGVYSLGL